MNRAIFLALAFIFLAGTAFGEDVNTEVPPEDTEPTQEEIMRQLRESQLRIEELQRRLDSPQVVTVQLDTEMRDVIREMQGQLSELSREISSFQEKFNRLRDEVITKFEAGQDSLYIQIMKDVSIQLTAQTKEQNDYVKYLTNPIRINLPNLGLWLMVTGLFMLVFVKKRGGS